MANPHDFLEDKFLDVGAYANAMELYKEDLVDLRDQLKIKVSVLNALIISSSSARHQLVISSS